MRFIAENEALDYLIGKEVLNASNSKVKYLAENREDSKYNYNKWIGRKRFMFSLQEFEALQGKVQNQSVRDHYGNVFADWAEDKPRRIAIIIVEATQKNAANAIAKQVDIIGGDQTFSGLGLSSTGKAPTTHYGCSWNCSTSEYDFLVKNFTVHDGERVPFDGVLNQLGLRQVQEEPKVALERS